MIIQIHVRFMLNGKFISLLLKQTNLFSSYITSSVFSIFFLVFYEHIRYNKGKIRYVLCFIKNT